MGVRLATGKYPNGDMRNIKFLYAGDEFISLEFARRLSAWAYAFGLPLHIGSGFRSIAKQTQMYNEDLRAHGGKPSGKVARPAGSYHCFSVAIDVSTGWDLRWRSFLTNGDYRKPWSKQAMLKYGLSLPLNTVECRTPEYWHIEPIECRYYHGDRTKFLDPSEPLFGKTPIVNKVVDNNDGVMTIQEFQSVFGLTVDGKVGAYTVTKAQEVLNCIGDIFNSAPTYTGNKIQVNGKLLTDKTFTVNNSTYAKLRPIIEASGNNAIAWDATSKTVVITPLVK